MTRSLANRLFSPRTAVLLPALAAVLSLATGIANISVGAPAGPFADQVPGVVRSTAGFTGTLTGFLLLLASWGLRRRTRVGWYATVVLLPVSAAQGIIQASSYSLPLVAVSLVALPFVIVQYRAFTRSVTLTTAQLAALVALSGTLAYGTIGTYTLRDEYGEVGSLTDAFYYTVVTASTVGYGDMTPISGRATLFATTLVVLGTASFAVALGSVLGPAIQARFSRALGTMTDTQYDLLEDHVLVLGYGELTEPLLEELAATTFVVVTPEQETARKLRDRGIDVQVGDPSDEEPLQAAGIQTARAAIVATNVDAEDAFTILTARELNPGLRIVAAATVRDNVEKLRRAGADTVLSPAVIGGQLLVRSALGETDIEGLADDLLDERP